MIQFQTGMTLHRGKGAAGESRRLSLTPPIAAARSEYSSCDVEHSGLAKMMLRSL